MTKLNPRTFGAVLSITVVMSYIMCALFWYSFTGSAIEFLNALFHGVDFTKIYAPAPFAISSFLYVLAVLAVWAYILGAIYALIRNWIHPEPIAHTTVDHSAIGPSQRKHAELALLMKEERHES